MRHSRSISDLRADDAEYQRMLAEKGYAAKER